jgi:hypothetical protein
MNSPFFNRCPEEQHTSALQIPAGRCLAVVFHPGQPKSRKNFSHFLGSKFPNQSRFNSSYISKPWICYQYRIGRAGTTFASSKRTEIRTIIRNSHVTPSVSPSNTMADANKVLPGLGTRLHCNYLAKKGRCSEASGLKKYCL